MKRTVTTAVLAGVGAGAAAIRKASRSSLGALDRDQGHESADRWRVVTVNRPPEDVAPEDRWPAPLAELGDAVEVRTRPAPGGKGTELAARWRSPDPPSSAGDDPARQLRSALRESKQLLEVGEVLRLDPKPEGRREPTPGGKLLDAVTRRAGGEGVR